MPDKNISIILKTLGLTREINNKILIQDINIEVSHGEILAIVGPSGSGKSTLLRLLNRLDEPTSGTVIFKGVDYKNYAARELRRQIGMLMQQSNLFPGTVRENICFGPLQRGEFMSDKKVYTLLGQVNLPGFAERNVGTLSGGEAQRVSLARTLANTPEILLLDEPTSALDEQSQQSVEELLLQIISDSSLTSIFITHDIPQAKRLANRILRMENGEISPFEA